jgi:hypothetical protein
VADLERCTQERADAGAAELDRLKQSHDTALSESAQRLEELREQLVAERKDSTERCAALHAEAQRDLDALHREIEELRNRSAESNKEHSQTLDQLEAVELERDRLAPVGAELSLRIKEQDSELSTAAEALAVACNESQRRQEEGDRLRNDLDQALKREWAAGERYRALNDQLEVEQFEAQRHRQVASAERLEYQARVVGLHEEIEALQKQSRTELEETRRRYLDELAELREENQQESVRGKLLLEERNLVQSEIERLIQERDDLIRRIPEIEADRERAATQSQAENARLGEALAAAERHQVETAGRNQELTLEIVALEIERDRLRIELQSRPQPREDVSDNLSEGEASETNIGRGESVSAGTTTVPASAEEDNNRSDPDRVEVDLESLEAYETELCTVSDQLPARNGMWSSRSQHAPQASPAVAFPSEADLALVRGQIELLNELLRPEQAAGQVLIYQRRLSEFTQKMREASRLATHLASEVELSRQRDQMQYHLYLLRRAEEIEKT